MSQWKNKVVVVTGGSDGLGAKIVRAFASRGATVISLARSLETNQAAANQHQAEGRKVTALSADVTDPDSLATVVAEIESQFGRIDTWVNNVGRSTRSDVTSTTVEEYQSFMEINFYSAVNCWHACKASLIKSSGQMVNIGSLASKTGWPLMAPYSTSKHALAAFTHQLRLEGPGNVHFMHICPGPIRRSETAARYVDDKSDLPSAAREPGAGAAVKGIPPERVAERLVRGCEKRTKEIVLPWKARILFSLAQLSPGIGDWLLRKFKKS